MQVLLLDRKASHLTCKPISAANQNTYTRRLEPQCQAPPQQIKMKLPRVPQSPHGERPAHKAHPEPCQALYVKAERAILSSFKEEEDG